MSTTASLRQRLYRCGFALLAVLLAGCTHDSEPLPWKLAIAEGTVIRLQRPRPRAALPSVAPETHAAETTKLVIPPTPTQAADLETSDSALAQARADRSAQPDNTRSARPTLRISGAAVTTEQNKPAELSLDEVIQHTRARFGGLSSYVADLVKQEVVAGVKKDRETIRIFCHCAKQQFLLQWLDTKRQGRLIAFNAREAAPLLSIQFGRKEPSLFSRPLKLPADNVFVQMGNRYPVTELGLDAWIRNLEALAERRRTGDPRGGVLEWLKPERLELRSGRWHYRIRQHARPGATLANLPAGGCRDWHIDCATLLPVLVTATSSDKEMIEFYHLSNLQLDVDLNPDDLLLEKTVASRTEPGA